MLAQPALSYLKLVEPTSEPVEWPRTGQPHPRVRTVYRAPEMVSTQPFADAHVLAQPALSCPKLVEPTSERQRAGRVETTVRTSEKSRSGLLFGCRMVSTRAAPSSQPGSTNFRERTPFLVHESRKKNGSTSCGDVEPSNPRDSCLEREGQRDVYRGVLYVYSEPPRFVYERGGAKRRWVAHEAAQFVFGTMGSGSQLVGAVPLPATGSGRRAAPQLDGGADLADR